MLSTAYNATVRNVPSDWMNPHLPLPPAALSSRELNELMQAAEGRDEAVIVDQHVVSQVVLREFSSKDRNGGASLTAYNLEFGSSKLLGTRGCGKIKNWMPIASSSIEELWQRTETHLAKALRSLKEGRIFSNEASARVLRDAVALHYVRSAHMRSIAQNAASEAWIEQFPGLIRMHHRRLAHEFEFHHGRPPSSLEECQEMAENIVRERQQEMLRSLLRVKVEEAFRRV